MTSAEHALRIPCPTCDTPAGIDCDPPLAGHTRGRLHNRRVKDGWRLRMAAIVEEINATAPSTTRLDDALRELFAEVLRSWNPPGLETLLRLPLSHPDEMIRQELRGKIKSFAISLAARAHAGDSDDRLRAQVERSIWKIIKLDSGAE